MDKQIEKSLLLGAKLRYLKNKCGIYLIEIDKHKYVGSSVDLSMRLSNHRGLLINNKHKNKFMQSCYNECTEINIYYSILEYCDKSERLEKERDWIIELNADLNMVKDPSTMFNCPSTSKTVYQYDLSGKYIGEFISTNEASRILNLDQNTIAKCASNNYPDYKI